MPGGVESLPEPVGGSANRRHGGVHAAAVLRRVLHPDRGLVHPYRGIQHLRVDMLLEIVLDNAPGADGGRRRNRYQHQKPGRLLLWLALPSAAVHRNACHGGSVSYTPRSP